MISLITPVWATEVEQFDPDQPFEQALSGNFLRSLLNPALDELEDHVEITGHLNPDASRDKDRHFRFKFYPEGKSKSDQHLTVEGSFQFSPEARQHEGHFKFKLPKDRPQNLPPQFEAPL